MGFTLRRPSFIKPPTLALDSHVDVLIIGADPAGLLAAIGLAREDFSIRIIDQRTNKTMIGGADRLVPRTLEVLKSYGLADGLMQKAAQIHVASFYRPNSSGIKLASRTPNSPGASGHSSLECTIRQGIIEDVLIEALANLKVSVERSVQLVSLDMSSEEKVLQDPTSYANKIALRHSDGKSETIDAKYVIGADGVHSWVRDALKIGMKGNTSEYIWSSVDFIPKTNFPDIRNFSVVTSASGGCIIVPREDGKIRMFVQLEPSKEMYDPAGHMDLSKVSWQRVMRAGQKALLPYSMEPECKPEWHDAYRIRHRVASRFSSQSRAFIIGDASLLVSPLQSQSMNTGINDAYNLVWKLTYVLRGRAGLDLLKTYDEERGKHAQELIAYDKVMVEAFSTKVKNAKEHIANVMSRITPFGEFAAGVSVRYDATTSVVDKHQALATALTIGQRLPPGGIVRAADGRPANIHDFLPADGKFKLFVFAGDVSVPAQVTRLEELAKVLYGHGSEDSEQNSVQEPLWKIQGKDVRDELMQTYAIAHGTDLVTVQTDVKAAMGLDWTNIFVDAVDAFTPPQGELFRGFGVDSSGAVVVVRPDGFIGALAPVGAEAHPVLASYFKGFSS